MRETIAPKNRIDRQQRHEAFWQSRKKKFFLAVGVLGLLLQLLFIGNMSYLYGSIWKSSERYHAFKVLFIDYDEGIIGRSVSEAYKQLKGPTFPTFVQHNISQYPSSDDVVSAVKDTSYWAAFMVNKGASVRLALALQGGVAAETYNPQEALTYVWNEVRYPPFSDEVFEGSFQALAALTRVAYGMLNGSAAIGSMNTKDPKAVQALLNPIMVSDINIMSTTQGTKLFLNTVSMVMPILQQFFFLLILNGLSHELQLYSRLPVHISGLVRLGLSVAFDLVAALCMVGYIWAFRESWEVTANQFVLTWMVLWLLMHIHFLILDVSTAFLPLPALPFFILTWIITNITSSISPFEVNPGFYRWAYALPTNEAYTVLQDIWSFGNVPQLYRAMPVLFSWWIVGISLATYGHFFRCHKAWKQDERLERLEKRTPEGSQSDAANSRSSLEPLRVTPSQTLLEAAEIYRSAYGPSVPPPIGLWRAFAADSPDIRHPILTGRERNTSESKDVDLSGPNGLQSDQPSTIADEA